MVMRDADDWEFEDLNKAEAWITVAALEIGISFGDLRGEMDDAEETILKENDPEGFAKYGRCPDADLVLRNVEQLIESLMSQKSNSQVFSFSFASETFLLH